MGIAKNVMLGLEATSIFYNCKSMIWFPMMQIDLIIYIDLIINARSR